MSGGWRVAADIGGTFTDLVLVDPDGRCAAVAKLLTSVDDPARSITAGIEALLAEAGIEGAGVEAVVHGTTLVANSLIERRGALTALITTQGHRDVLEIGREARYELYDLDLEKPAPLVPRHRRLEVPERVLADGEVRTALDVDAVRDAARRLGEEGVESIAVVFLHSYLRGDHERAAAEAIAAELAEMEVTTSVEVLPELGEYARVSTTVANAYVRPLAREYLSSLQQRVQDPAPRATVALLTSTGRVTPAATAQRTPIRLLESGPAGGVLAALRAAAQAGIADCLAFDMGGTTAKAAYVEGGRPRLASTFEVARARRFARGSGLPIQLPAIELIEIGAGGGSVAWVDALGLLRVGPRSAGAEPGPACYGFGGSEPTVTDADLVLGHLDAASFLGGGMRIDAQLAREALETLAAPLGLDGAEAVARRVREVVDEQMAGAARMHAVEQGLDPAAHALVATGGAGPVHACSVARALGVARVLVPARAGVASAHGFLGAPFGFDVARSAPALLSELDWAAARQLLEQLEDEASSASQGRVTERRVEADLRYRGQGELVTVAVDEAVLDGADADALAEALAGEYRDRYGRVPEGAEPELLTWRVAVWGAEPALAAMAPEPERAPSGERGVFFSECDGFVDAPVRGRGAAEGDGPMVVEERESTLVVPPGARVEQVDGGSALLVEL